MRTLLISLLLLTVAADLPAVCQCSTCMEFYRNPDAHRLDGVAYSQYLHTVGGQRPDLTIDSDSPNESTTIAVYHQVAEKALAGDFGALTDWQHAGYTKLLTVTPERRLAWITVYNENDPGCNFTTASGRRVSRRVAAMLDTKWATWVLVDLPEGYQLRQCFDTGSRANAGRARSKGAQVWCDLYYSPAAMKTLKNGRGQSWVRPIYVF